MSEDHKNLANEEHSIKTKPFPVHQNYAQQGIRDQPKQPAKSTILKTPAKKQESTKPSIWASSLLENDGGEYDNHP